MDVGEISLPVSIDPNRFPAKLWRLVNNPANKAIFWNPCGEVVVIDQQLFQQQILSPGVFSTKAGVFKSTNFASFIRQLNLYGFRQVRKFHLEGCRGILKCFFNPNFKRNNPELMVNLKRLTVANRTKLQPDLEPDLSLGNPRGRDGARMGADGGETNVTTLVPSQYLQMGPGAALSPSIAPDNVMASLINQRFYDRVSRSSALHFQHNVLSSVNPGNQLSVISCNPCNAQYKM